MFGYITPLKDELKVREFTTFKSYYCGLCFHIKKGYGNLPRLSLNYDMTFLGLLLDSLNETPTIPSSSSCMTNPFKKKPVVMDNRALHYAATMNVALVYYKLLDDVADDKKISSKLFATMLKPYIKKFPTEIHVVLTAIEENLQRLASLEKNKSFSNIDEICHPFSLIVSTILSTYGSLYFKENSVLQNDLYQFGYALGKWIYLIDALDDLEKDIEKDKFNPLQYLYNKENLSYEELLPQIKERVAFTLLNCGYNCQTYLEALPIHQNKELLTNIINLGMMEQYTKVTTACGCKNTKRRG